MPAPDGSWRGLSQLEIEALPALPEANRAACRGWDEGRGVGEIRRDVGDIAAGTALPSRVAARLEGWCGLVCVGDLGAFSAPLLYFSCARRMAAL